MCNNRVVHAAPSGSGRFTLSIEEDVMKKKFLGTGTVMAAVMTAALLAGCGAPVDKASTADSAATEAAAAATEAPAASTEAAEAATQAEASGTVQDAALAVRCG